MLTSVPSYPFDIHPTVQAARNKLLRKKDKIEFLLGFLAPFAIINFFAPGCLPLITAFSLGIMMMCQMEVTRIRREISGLPTEDRLTPKDQLLVDDRTGRVWRVSSVFYTETTTLYTLIDKQNLEVVETNVRGRFRSPETRDLAALTSFTKAEAAVEYVEMVHEARRIAQQALGITDLMNKIADNLQRLVENDRPKLNIIFLAQENGYSFVHKPLCVGLMAVNNKRLALIKELRERSLAILRETDKMIDSVQSYDSLFRFQTTKDNLYSSLRSAVNFINENLNLNEKP